MADGGSQFEFNIPRAALVSALRPGEIVMDFFAGGGGASTALEQALGRPVDIAVNHDEFAIAMHAANHPFTAHMREDVWKIDPRREVAGRSVGWYHASPDCTHFSQAKGGQPRNGKIRALSWVVVKVVGMLGRTGNAPRLLSLENVEQILKWGPLVAKRCKATGRVVRIDGTIAAPGERVPLQQQWLVPDPKREGQTWARFVAILRGHGYEVEWRKLVASDYGAGTSRKRLFLLARRDGEPIVWPAPTHGPGLLPLVTAADCIDWSIECPSIFTRKKPLADATMRRIARGVQRYVIDAAEPFIVSRGGHHGEPDSGWSATSSGGANRPGSDGCGTAGRQIDAVTAPVLTEHANSSNARSWAADEPLRTQCANVKGGHFALAAATLVQTGYGEAPGQAPRVPGLGKPLGTLVDGQKHAAVAAHLVKFRGNSIGTPADEPVPTITSGGGAARPAGAAHALGVISAFMEQAAGGPNSNMARARAMDEPVSTLTTAGSQQRLVAVHLQHASTSNTNGGRGRVDLPLRTVMAGGQHHAIVEATLSPEQEEGALRVAAFLVNYYGNGQPLDLREPMDTVTTRDRLALVTVQVRGVPYVIVDIGLRMLQRHELFKAQGFPDDYIIDRTADGRRLTVSQSVRMVGNSVSPPPLRALIEANLPAVTA